jgi:hypothetical protein
MLSKRQVHTGGSCERKRVNKSVELSGCWKGRWMVGAAIRSDGDPRLARAKIDLKRDVIFDALACVGRQGPNGRSSSYVRNVCLESVLKNVRHNSDCCHRF